MHILDTDTLTHLHAGNPNVIRNLEKLGDPDVKITIITKIELLRGRSEFLIKASDRNQLVRAQKLFDRTEELLCQIPILPMDENSAIKFEALKKIKKLRKIGRKDILIASMALAHRAVLVTRNLRHFRQVPDLTVINWVD
ncbi:MAG: type II toxin-antitoxin system VapC family toxin [Deltaproteobacteria bacterium]|nr:MAG: type II toxin-antitoxin system VapC family toxin [Deltaproteobacteria bacterium]